MTSKTNTFEGQTSGTAWSVANSGGGSGDAWDALTTSGTVTAVYDNAQAFNGSQSLHLTCAASSQQIMRWTGLNGASNSARFYLRIVASSAAQDIVQFRNGSGQAAAIGLSSSRQLQIKNALGGVLTSFTALALNTWYRVEMQVTKGVATATPFDGTVTAAYYLGDSTTPVETAYTSTAVNTGTGNLVEWRIGKLTTSPSLEVFIDSVGVNDASANPLGTYSRAGSGVGVLTVTGNGAGSKKTSGVGVGALTLTGNGAGAKTATGSGASVLTLTGNGVGTKRAAGAGVSVLTITGNGAGSRIARGAGVGVLTVTGGGTGAKTGRGSGTSALTVTAGGTGSKRAAGAGTSLLTITGDGQGVAIITPPDIRYGGGTSVLNLTANGAGTKIGNGVGASLLTITGAGTGTKHAAGAGVSLLHLIGDGTGTRPVIARDLTFMAVIGCPTWAVNLGGRSWLVVVGGQSWSARVGDPMEMSLLSKEFVSARFTSTAGNGSDAVVFNTQPVYLALTQIGQTPSLSDFHPAEWVGVAGATRWARLLVGPGATPVLSPGEYDVWGRVEDVTEVAVRKLNGTVTFV